MYNFDEFTVAEIDILIDSLDEWVSKDFAGQMTGMLLEGLLPRDLSSEKREEWEVLKRKEKEKREAAKKLRKEQAIVMKAKLLKVKDGIEAGSI